MAASRIELDLSGFRITLLAQNQACSDDKPERAGVKGRRVKGKSTRHDRRNREEGWGIAMVGCVLFLLW